jgi:hypothetical protein
LELFIQGHHSCNTWLIRQKSRRVTAKHHLEWSCLQGGLKRCVVAILSPR